MSRTDVDLPRDDLVSRSKTRSIESLTSVGRGRTTMTLREIRREAPRANDTRM